MVAEMLQKYFFIFNIFIYLRTFVYLHLMRKIFTLRSWSTFKFVKNIKTIYVDRIM